MSDTNTATASAPHGLKAVLKSIEAKTAKNDKQTPYLKMSIEVNSKAKGGVITNTAMAWGKAGDGLRGLPVGSKVDLFGRYEEGSFTVLRGGLQTTKAERDAAKA